jgi:hypothetical protein
MIEEQESGNVVSVKTKLTPEQQSAVLSWPHRRKIPIIHCDSKTKRFDSQWKSIDFSQIDFSAKLAAGEYDNGIALVLGKRRLAK